MNKIWIFLAPKNINHTIMALVLRETEFILKIIFHIGFLLYLTEKSKLKVQMDFLNISGATSTT